MSNFSVVVINYNGKEFLRQSLQYIKISNLKPEKVIVVDDASTDGSCELVEKRFPEFFLFRHKKNRGPGAARNTGAREAKGKYIIFIDNDVLVKKNTFGKLERFMETHPEAGICSPKLKPEDKEKMWWNMGHDFNPFRKAVGDLFEKLWRIFPNSQFINTISTPFTLNLWDYDQLRVVDWVSETCNIARKEIFDRLGGFDENFFMFHEGPDLCRRMRKSGLKVYFNPEVEVRLLEGHTHTSQKRKKWMIYSTIHYCKKHWLRWE